MPEFSYTDLLPLGADDTTYRLITEEGVTTRQSFGKTFTDIAPAVLTQLTSAAMHDIAHLLRPSHLSQLRSILDDPEASPNDRYVARDLLKNACIAAGGVLPMCQDTGTAIVMGKRGQHVLTDGCDEEHIARGVYDASTTLNLRYSQMAPLTMWEERNTAATCRPRSRSTPPGATLQLPVHGEGRRIGEQVVPLPGDQGSTEPRPGSSPSWRRRSGHWARPRAPPRRLAIVVGGTSAEFALKTANYASAHYLERWRRKARCLVTASVIWNPSSRYSSSPGESGSAPSSVASTSAMTPG